MKLSVLLVASLLMTQCTAEVVCRVPSFKITHRDKFEREGEFIGFADGRAFKAVKTVPPFGGAPRRAIWWCYESELPVAAREHLARQKR